MAVRIVTDSTADLPPELCKEMDITVVPLTVRFGEESFLDGVDIDADQFFERLTTDSQLPSTSQPSPGAFLEVYKGLVEAGHQIVSIHISDKISGTLNSARQAREQLYDAPLEIIDSNQASASLGLLVTAAARAVRDGASFDETLQVTRRAVGQVQFFAVLDTLEYLQRGGRIGKVQAIVGSLLRIRPIVTLEDGLVHSLAKVRSRAQGLQYILNAAEKRAPLKQVTVAHATTPQDADDLAAKLRPLLSDGSVIRTRLGPVIGTYAGPGAIGIAVQSEKPTD